MRKSTYTDDYIDQERKKGSTDPKVEATSDLAYPAGKRVFESVTVMRPSGWQMLQSGVILFFLLLAWLAMPLTYSVGNLLVVAGLPAVMILVARDGFFRRKYIYSITVSADGILIRGTFFDWKDVGETAIMEKFIRRTTVYFLILFRKDGPTETYDLRKFRINGREMATMIEFYKTRSREEH